MRNLVLILGDQLSATISSLRDMPREDTIVLMVEVAEEAAYVRHHRRKLAYILSAMRHHAEALRRAGWTVDYVRLDADHQPTSFTGEVAAAIERHRPDRLVVTEAGEWRVQQMLESWQTLFGIPVEIRTDDRFIASHADFQAWAGSRANPVMEFFYREQRRKTGLLMTADGKPEGGRWNYDKENRKPAENDLFMPEPPRFSADAITQEVIALVQRRFQDLLGSLDDWDLAVTREDALKAQAAFLDQALCSFGDYQDAMVSGAHRMWHSHLSPYLNSGLLDPLELCREVEARYRAGRVALNCAEGFIQIIGWREYMRGIYWLAGPGYIDRNFFGFTRRLPSFYWTGETDMNCMRQVLGQTWTYAYAHHIQRLMVTGNFALLIGADPKAVHLWYMEVYLDAYEWVTLPNTLGMSQFGDGGLVGTKPYVSTGQYIDRMSDYCGRCRYDVKQRTGPDACPFNSLYWDFLARERDKLGSNPRLRNIYRTWDRFSPATQQEIRSQAAGFLATPDEADYATGE